MRKVEYLPKKVISFRQRFLNSENVEMTEQKEKLKNLNKLKNEKWKLSWMMKPRKTWQI